VTPKNPNAMLRRIRACVMALSRGHQADTPPALNDLIQAFQDLDNHLSWGGRPPEWWAAASLRRPVTPHEETDPVEDIIRRM
jgi:hypothetical protein